VKTFLAPAYFTTPPNAWSGPATAYYRYDFVADLLPILLATKIHDMVFYEANLRQKIEIRINKIAINFERTVYTFWELISSKTFCAYNVCVFFTLQRNHK